MVATAVMVQLVQLVTDRSERMRRASLPDFAHDYAQSISFRELCRIQVATIPLQDGPDFLDDLAWRAFGRRKVALQAVNIRTEARLYGFFDVPFSNGGVLLTDTR